LDELDPFDSALSLLEIASSLHSSQRESLESVDFFVEDELPCPSALLKIVGSSSLGFVELPPSPLHAAKKATMLNATKIFFIKPPGIPNNLIFPPEI
jgi:hypothetical protein